MLAQVISCYVKLRQFVMLHMLVHVSLGYDIFARLCQVRSV